MAKGKVGWKALDASFGAAATDYSSTADRTTSFIQDKLRQKTAPINKNRPVERKITANPNVAEIHGKKFSKNLHIVDKITI